MWINLCKFSGYLSTALVLDSKLLNPNFKNRSSNRAARQEIECKHQLQTSQRLRQRNRCRTVLWTARTSKSLLPSLPSAEPQSRKPPRTRGRAGQRRGRDDVLGQHPSPTDTTDLGELRQHPKPTCTRTVHFWNYNVCVFVLYSRRFL